MNLIIEIIDIAHLVLACLRREGIGMSPEVVVGRSGQIVWRCSGRWIQTSGTCSGLRRENRLHPEQIRVVAGIGWWPAVTNEM